VGFLSNRGASASSSPTAQSIAAQSFPASEEELLNVARPFAVD
jgi:hypothetical protein